jgi:hypothetical protein
VLHIPNGMVLSAPGKFMRQIKNHVSKLPDVFATDQRSSAPRGSLTVKPYPLIRIRSGTDSPRVRLAPPSPLRGRGAGGEGPVSSGEHWFE